MAERLLKDYSFTIHKAILRATPILSQHRKSALPLMIGLLFTGIGGLISLAMAIKWMLDGNPYFQKTQSVNLLDKMKLTLAQTGLKLEKKKNELEELNHQEDKINREEKKFSRLSEFQGTLLSQPREDTLSTIQDEPLDAELDFFRI